VENEVAVNQIIIPYGKRSEITLADGTHIWLNSGSQLSYPSRFKTNSRDVYLTGEAFFDVTADANKPFYVMTRDFKIKVLGTKFNVSSYSEDRTIQTVLLKGKVSAGKNKLFAETIDLYPGERLVYDKAGNNLAKEKVDVQLYTSWINGYLIFDNEPTTEVFKKLERYYNQRIIASGGLGGNTFSGKLDLKDNIKDVLDNISFASSVKATEENGSFIIK
jgi:ferric-dicitrate binding protein FerR (iron transport regulator)